MKARWCLRWARIIEKQAAGFIISDIYELCLKVFLSLGEPSVSTVSESIQGSLIRMETVPPLQNSI